MTPKYKNFIYEIIERDRSEDKYSGRIATRFPPEPNGYLHIGHAKSICLNFTIARDYEGTCNLRFDDTNPEKEEEEFINSIIEDVKWLGFKWDELCFASDYFQEMYEYALKLIEKGDAYVDDLSPEKIREYRGTLTRPGKNSPHRKRSVQENLELFKDMKNGKFAEGQKVLRAKIDMGSGNLNMRDPIMYRIVDQSHPRTEDEWNIYPTYDWAHGLEDSIEKITHSLCTLEFEDHRPLYNWFLEKLEMYHPRQIEFARLNLSYTVLSKRKLSKLVDENYVNGWDDPRMPTLSGMRRRGYPPAAIRDFCDKIGVSKANSRVDIALLEHCVRDNLNKTADRVFVILDPVKVVITDYPEDKSEKFEVENNPEDKSAGKREVTFTKELYIEREDFQEDPDEKFFRLYPDKEVRLKHAYYITCREVVKDEKTGKIKELRCTHDPDSRGGWNPDGHKVKGTLHWVSAKEAVNIKIRNYDRLFDVINPEKTEDGGEYTDNLNENSLTVNNRAVAEAAVQKFKPGKRVQFFRQGYYSADLKDYSKDNPVFNRIVPLKDTWAKIQKNQ
ncbi:MAG: glutamine--tRNA ligase/YqeY domain fusion protein [Elusimicrobiota bacterium]